MNFVASIVKALMTKKLLILILKKIAQSTENELDNNAVLVVEGLLNAQPEKVEEGVIGLVEEVVPHVVDHFHPNEE